MERKLIRSDGSVTMLPGPVSMQDIRTMIGADTLDTVNLHHLGRPLWVMVVDDLGHPKELPVNEQATRLYHANCIPGTTHEIRGDVVIVLDDDYAGSGS